MVRDKDAKGELGITHTPKYIEAKIKLLEWSQQGSVNLIYNIVEIEP